MEDILKEIADQYSQLECVYAVVQSGSRTSGQSDDMSDYDIYVYSDMEIPVEFRTQLAKMYSNDYEIDNRYFETGDEWNLKNGNGLDFMFRSTNWIQDCIENVYNKLIDRAVRENPFCEAYIIPFYDRNVYYLTVYKVFKDIPAGGKGNIAAKCQVESCHLAAEIGPVHFSCCGNAGADSVLQTGVNVMHIGTVKSKILAGIQNTIGVLVAHQIHADFKTAVGKVAIDTAAAGGVRNVRSGERQIAHIVDAGKLAGDRRNSVVIGVCKQHTAAQHRGSPVLKSVEVFGNILRGIVNEDLQRTLIQCTGIEDSSKRINSLCSVGHGKIPGVRIGCFPVHSNKECTGVAVADADDILE